MKKNIVRHSEQLQTLTLSNDQDSIAKIISAIFSHRGTDTLHTDYSLQKLLRPTEMHGLSSAVDILEKAIQQQQRILVVGDFDADGATSSALSVLCLRSFGFQSVDFLVPNRFEYGYGLTPEIVDVALQYSPDILLTVDNGISSVEGVERANQLGMQVIVTDHHLPGRELPKAAAIVNPNQDACNFPSKNLAGVGVIFYLLSALRTSLRENDWFKENNIAEPNMGNYLDIVALGTVADVVPLDHNNRILVAAGLKKMREGRAVPGIQALLRVAGKDPKNISASDLGFAVGPRLNAAGRLDDMSLGIRCLMTKDVNEALNIASQLDDLNKERKAIEASMQVEAKKLLQHLSEHEFAQDMFGVCMYKEDWHQGVIGILASRIKDFVHRPTIIFAQSDNGELKGSGRSIGGLHLRDILDEVATQTPGIINKFGGHAMAAGLSIQESKFDEFKTSFNKVVEKYMLPEHMEPVIFSDGQLPLSLIGMPLALALRAAGPWGQHFSEPAFDGEFNVLQQRIVGEKHLKLLLQGDRGQPINAIAFNVDVAQWPDQHASRIKLAYKLDVNEYRGEQSAQLLVDYLEKIGE